MAAALRELGYSVNDFPEHLHGGLFLSIQLGFEEIKNDLKLIRSLHLPCLPRWQGPCGGAGATLRGRGRRD